MLTLDLTGKAALVTGATGEQGAQSRRTGYDVDELIAPIEQSDRTHQAPIRRFSNSNFGFGLFLGVGVGIGIGIENIAFRRYRYR